MKIRFNCFSADELVGAYLEFIRKRNSKEVYAKYFSDKFGFKEAMEGRLDINDIRLTGLPKKLQHTDTKHELELSQKNWKSEFCLKLTWGPNAESLGEATLSFEDSLKKEVYNHFKKFEPKEIIG